MGNKSNWFTIDAIDENPKSGGDRKPDSGAVTDDFIRIFHRNRQPESLEAKILFDAGKLDATGAPYGVLYREVKHGYASGREVLRKWVGENETEWTAGKNSRKGLKL